MLKMLFVLTRFALVASLMAAGSVVLVHAQTPSISGITAHWHCSKHPASPDFDLAAANSPHQAPGDKDLFDLTPAHTGTVGVSLPDLIDAYSGRPVTMGSQQLTACFMIGQTALNQSAHERVGLHWPTLQLQQRSNNLRYSHIRMVQSETEMLQCIANHYPAVGYLSHPTNTPTVGPCF